MIDFARITIRAGDGGQGSGSFRHIKGKRYGKADGGDGGGGGNVYCQATRDLNTLEPYRYVKDYKAENGQPGASNLRRGVNGQDEVLKVPVGTQINILLGPATNFPPAFGEARLRRPVSAPSRGGSNLDGKSFGSLRAAGNPSIGVTQQNVIYDLVEEGQRVLVASGGEGGRGNAKLRDGFGRRPRTGEKGQIGETCNITLELKLIADVGLVGLPNSGKSTLLSVLTSARPKIADYPFTTLEPNLGVMDFAGPVSSFLPAFGEARLRRPASARSREQSNVSQQDQGSLRAVGIPSSRATRSMRLVVADIPGLIEGASKGKGLGDLFLRHIERTRVLVHLVDVSAALGPVSSFLPTFGEARLRRPTSARLRELSGVDGQSLGELRAVGTPSRITTRTDFQRICFVFAHKTPFHPESKHVMGEDSAEVARQARNLIDLLEDTHPCHSRESGNQILNRVFDYTQTVPDRERSRTVEDDRNQVDYDKCPAVDGFFSGDLHFFAKYQSPNKSVKITTIGAIASDRNFQGPRFAILTVWDDYSWEVEDIEIR